MPNTTDQVLVDETTEAIRVVTLSRPDRRNALNASMLTALRAALPKHPAGPGQPIRAVIIEGAAGTFSSGFDLGDLNEAERQRGVDPITATADAIAACPVPVIVAVDGHCHGGAVELCAAAHIVVAVASTRFSVPAVRLGLVYPASGLVRFRLRLGRRAERVLLTGTSFGANDACAWGLVDDIAADARSHARLLAGAIANAAPLAVSGTLVALRAIDADDARAAEAARGPALASVDLLEGVAAAQSKRPPVFGGH